MDHIILSLGQVMRTTFDLPPTSPNYHTTLTGGRLSHNRPISFNIMKGLRRFSMLLYMIGWIWPLPASGSDMRVRFYDSTTIARFHALLDFFPTRQSQGIAVSRPYRLT
ncbi:hypothetical protein TNCV_1656591 [Trichonephila clavipes]|nr:hypothetical protein TNCV_1656591 [Trichonephila clavipes]